MVCGSNLCQHIIKLYCNAINETQVVFQLTVFNVFSEQLSESAFVVDDFGVFKIFFFLLFTLV